MLRAYEAGYFLSTDAKSQEDSWLSLYDISL